MTAIAERRRRRTIIAAIAAMALVASSAVMFTVGVVTLSNSEEGEAVGIDERPRERLPETPNALLAVQDDDGRLASLVVLTLLPDGRGGSIVTLPVTADSSAGFAREAVALDVVFDPSEVPTFVAAVEEMLSITIQRAAVVDPGELESLLEPVGAVQAQLPFDVFDEDGDAEADVDAETDAVAETDADAGSTTESSGAEVVARSGPTSLSPSEVAAVLTAVDPDAGSLTAHLNDVAVWEALASAAPLLTPPESLPTDEFGRLIPPDSVEQLLELLFAGEAVVRDVAIAINATAGEGDDRDPVLIDRRDTTMVFAQVSPALMSTPNSGLKLRILAPYTDEQLDRSDGLFDATSSLVLDFIGQMLFFQNNVVSVDSAASGAPDVTVVEVADERFLDEITENAEAVFGEAEVRVAETVLEGVDAEITLGMSYIVREMVRSGADAGGADDSQAAAPSPTTEPAEPTTTVGVNG